MNKEEKRKLILWVLMLFKELKGMGKYYRIKVKKYNKDKMVYIPQTKRGLFGEWQGIIAYNNQSFEIGKHHTIKEFELKNMIGLQLDDKKAAIYFIDGYKKQILKEKRRIKYIRVK